MPSPFCTIVISLGIGALATVPLAPVRAQARLSTFPNAPVPKPFHLDDSSGDNLREEYISWRKLPRRILHDQKDIWLFPNAIGHYLAQRPWLSEARPL